MANRVIEQGLVESGKVKMVERFQTVRVLVQCFRTKCYSYEHIAKQCQVSAQCDHFSIPGIGIPPLN